MNNDGGKSEGEDINEDLGEASGEEASLPKPKPKKIYNTVEFSKSKICISTHKKRQQKENT